MADTQRQVEYSLRLIAARIKLGIIDPDDIPPAADQALNAGVYSHSLADLWLLVEPRRSDVGALADGMLAELGLPVLDGPGAARFLLRHAIEQIPTESESQGVKDLLEFIHQVHSAAAQFVPDRRVVGDNFDIGELIGLYDTFDSPDENYYEPEDRIITDESERRAILSSLARQAAREWLARHPHP